MGWAPSMIRPRTGNSKNQTEWLPINGANDHHTEHCALPCSRHTCTHEAMPGDVVLQDRAPYRQEPDSLCKHSCCVQHGNVTTQRIACELSNATSTDKFLQALLLIPQKSLAWTSPREQHHLPLHRNLSSYRATRVFEPWSGNFHQQSQPLIWNASLQTQSLLTEPSGPRSQSGPSQTSHKAICPWW